VPEAATFLRAKQIAAHLHDILVVSGQSASLRNWRFISELSLV
jgi:hypothetical protein